ncbi:hypothetical protein K493DRAFT_254641 [Basidiobolus meristosporus CBS 931.73]|uniref:Zn(2)-C6 fungal-type domain-containing protein n=1 Tax=Basidiobolus meristosporus CBS 931.73 TaxID=1314790 RepID=A0A1Y1YYM7_9FUNG|nr:hypothetical protein K493DRAFT_254641 [Basidiobolus meristosporus CBS 931.73]|eukprot:ORY02807.1 hypothetical protein K493DRAFT_254641 [Basidiobolus meristosporus CBS 931.73]
MLTSQEASFSSEANANKKSRTSRACDLCRRKKVKCDGLKPTCSNCSSLGHDCTYLDKPKKRGPQSSQPKALEARLKHLESLLTSLVDNGGAMTNQIANELRSINEHGDSSPNIESPEQEESEEELSEDEDHSADEDAALDVGDKPCPQDVSYRYAGSSSGMYLLNDNIKRSQSVHDIRKLLPEAYNDIPDLPESFPPPELGEKLLKIYFCRFHPYMPVFHANGFMNKYREGKVPPIVLNAVYGLACIHSGDHNIFPDVESYTKYAQMFFLRTKAYLDQEYHSSSIPVIQALFLMTFSPTSGWLFLGMAIRMAQDLGLHRNIESQSMDPIEREDRRLLWWCCVVMDRFQSSALGKPMSISETDFDTKLPLEIASSQPIFTNLPNSVVSLRYFTHLIRLTSIIGRIMKEVYGVDSPPNATGKILWTLNTEIRDWEATLPAEFKYDYTRPLKNNVHSIMLNTFCQFAVILLNRPFIPRANKYKKSTAISPALKVCSRAASIMTFISYHTPNGYRLHGVIFKTLFTFSSSMIHLISSLSNAPDIAQTGRINLSFNLRLLQEYQEISSGSARCLNFMREIVQDRKVHKVNELPPEPPLPPPVPISPDLNNKTPKRSDSGALLIIPERHFGSPVNRNSGSLSPTSITTLNSVKMESPSEPSQTTTPTVTTYPNLNQINIADPIFQYPNISQTMQGPRNLFSPEAYSSPGNYMNSQREASVNSSMSLSEIYQQDCAPGPFIGNPQFYNNHQMDINMQEWNNYIDQFSNFASPSM